MVTSVSKPAVTAALLTALVAIPSVSGDINYGTPEPEPVIVDSESDMEVDVRVPEDVNTTAEIERHDAVYRFRQSPEIRYEVYETPGATLKSVLEEDRKIFRLETPASTLVRGLDSSRKVFRFTGRDREDAVERMNSMTEDLEEMRQRVKNRITPDLDVKIVRSAAADVSERAIIENQDSREINLASWTLRNGEGDNYTFGEKRLDPDTVLRVYTASESEINGTEPAVHGTGVDWDQGDDEASLFNPEDVQIAGDSY